MSGRTKRIIYEILEIVLGLIAIVGTILVGFFGVIQDANQTLGCGIALIVFGLFCILLPISVLIHELGHFLFGLVSGLKFISLSVACFQVTGKGIHYIGKRGFSGETQMLPKSEKRVRSKMACFSLGGAFLNLVFGAVFLALFFVVPIHPVLFFFELCAPFNLFEGIVALLPAELEAGRTDGKMFLEIVKDTPYSKVFLSVLTAQGLLFSKSFTEIEKRLLFDLPVIREDEPAFLALTQLRWQYLFMNGNEEDAAVQIRRLEELAEYLPEAAARAELACDVAYGHRVLYADTDCVELLQSAEAAEGSLPYALARFAIYGEEEDAVIAAIEKERMIGIKELSKAMLSRAKKILPPKEQNEESDSN
ncbi:MAG: M50 family metallopeptidase [Clostridia bacterium]|nr:M50 family metallopeptidase [Clostridia bacterium]